MRKQRPQSGVIRLTDAIKAIGPATTFVFLLLLASFVLVLGRFEPAAVERVRTAMIDTMAPVLDVLARPIDTTRQLVDEIDSHMDLRAENLRLKEEVERLNAWQALARNLVEENKSLRQLTGLSPDPQTTFVTARVVADAGGPFVRTILISAGEKDGIQRGQAIATGDGIVGRIVGVGARASRVLLLTDLNSRVPVIIQGTKLRSMLIGDNSPHPKLDFLPSSAAVNPGDRIVTSGDGGMFPAGLPVGVVKSMDGRIPRIQLFVDLKKLDFVRVLRFQMQLNIDDTGPMVIAPPGSGTPLAAAPLGNAGMSSPVAPIVLRDLAAAPKTLQPGANARSAAPPTSVADPAPTPTSTATGRLLLRVSSNASEMRGASASLSTR